ncbi:MAG TPA: L-lactate permease [Micropepsaceae bacterium]|jgi:lactate permease|nr:L-lactate permease [Micropepsaceae bacterium]
MWSQVYNPFGNAGLSTLAAAVPAVFLLIMIASGRVKVHIAAIVALATAVAIAVFGFTMPAGMALRAVGFGLITGFFPIGWIILNVIFLYRLTDERGWFAIMQRSIGEITPDRRLQLLLIAFAFGAFFEGASGFGTPVAVTGQIMMGLGFSPLASAGLSLIANTAPVAFGALGAPIAGLATATGIDPYILGAMVGRQLPLFSAIVPFWLIWAFAGWRGAKEIWPAALVCGLSFGVTQFLISNYISPWIAAIGSALVCLVCLRSLLYVWQPATIWTSPALRIRDDSALSMPPVLQPKGGGASGGQVALAWMPWVILCVVLSLWGVDAVKAFLNSLFAPAFPVPGLHNLVLRMPPVVAMPTPEPAVFVFTFLSYSGTGILVSAIISGFLMGFSPLRMAQVYIKTISVVGYSLITISCMLAIGTLTRYAGVDATLGLAFAGTGVLYPFFGTLLGWLGVALTGSDTASNVLFGGLQKITSQQLGLSPILMAAANSSGGVMGKMIDAQSIVVASTATRWVGHEGTILRFVFKHSIVLAILVGLLVTLQAYVYPFTEMVLK